MCGEICLGEEAVLAQRARRGCEPLLVERDGAFRLAQPRPRRDQLVMRLVPLRVELDRPLIELSRPPQLVTGMRLEQKAVVVQQTCVSCVSQRPLEELLRRQEITLLAKRLVAL